MKSGGSSRIFRSVLDDVRSICSACPIRKTRLRPSMGLKWAVCFISLSWSMDIFSLGFFPFFPPSNVSGYFSAISFSEMRFRTSGKAPLSIARQFAHSSQESSDFFRQLSALASTRAVSIFPTPSGPVKRRELGIRPFCSPFRRMFFASAFPQVSLKAIRCLYQEQ